MLKICRGLAAAFLALGIAGTASGQSTTILPRAFETVDQNGVAFIPNGGFKVSVPEPSISIGDPNAGGLTWQRVHEAATSDPMRRHSLMGVLAYCDPGLNPPFFPAYSASVGESSDTFQFAFSGSYQSNQYTGATLVLNTAPGEHTYKTGDGSVVVYDTTKNQLTNCGYGPPIKSLTKPDGEVITWHYAVTPSGPYADQIRLQSVTNNLGYQIHLQYARDALSTTTAEIIDWSVITKVTAIDNALNPCAPLAYTCSDSTGAAWPYLTYSYQSSNTVEVVTDRNGGQTIFTYNGVVRGFASPALLSVSSPQSPSADLSFSYTGGLQISGPTGSWTYSSVSGTSSTVSGPGGYTRQITFSDPYATGLAFPASYSLPLQDTLNGRTTTFLYEDAGPVVAGRLERVTGHDGDYVEYEYDARRNVTHSRSVAKPGSGLADIHVYASYPEPTNAVCVNFKTCNKPLTVTDARGFVTTYTYDAGHGGLLTETKPAPGSGPYASIQPQTRYTYDATGGITRVATVKSCRTTASCAGGVDETVVENTYTAKRVPSLVVTRAGNNTTTYTATNSRVAVTYTPQGDVETVDGPLSGTADKVWNYYDTVRRLRVTVAPDPDGGGSLQYRARRTTYDADGNPIMAEQGSVSAPANCSAANNFCAATMTVLAKSTVEYDSYGRKIRENVINVGTTLPEAVTQYKYDTAGRVECVATRMNAAVYGSPPTDACVQSTTGSFGEDQVVRTTYTVNGDTSVIQSGYGTSLVRNERTFTYLAPGQTGTVKDAANNLTTYEYDGFDRPKKVRYPVTTVGANASSTTDYEEYGYDAAGNRTSERRRDGAMIYNGYDNLTRLVTKGGSTIADVTNGYDNFDNLTSASHALAAVSWTYDALGRVLTEVQPNGTVSYAYDTAGRRTQLTYPGSGFYTNYQYYDDGRLKLIGLNGASAGGNVLATYYDDQLGRRASMCRGTGTSSSCSSVARTTWSHDAISRLSGLSHDLTTGGSANDLSRTFSYSPASQLVTRTAATALYEWTYGPTFSDAYVANGLNQYTSVAGGSLTYDGRGNTTNDTTKGYSYDGLNRLTSATNGAGLAYDPTGRLMSATLSGTTTKFLYDGTRLIAEYDGSNALLRRYVHGDGVDDPIVWYDSSGTTNKRNLFKDERGSIVAADTGSAVTTIKYDEYGNPNITGSTIPRFQYTGQAWLSEIGLYYYKARIYNPDLGRFMQTDPIGYEDQMNLYAYVRNDPFNRVDPSGLFGGSPGDDAGDIVLVIGKRITPGVIEVPTIDVFLSVGPISPQISFDNFRFDQDVSRRNGQKPPSHDENDPDYNRDLNQCRAYADSGDRARANDCYGNAEKRRRLRNDGAREDDLPPLVNWYSTPAIPGSANTSSPNPWVVGAVAGAGAAAIVCAILEPCGAIALGVGGILGLTAAAN